MQRLYGSRCEGINFTVIVKGNLATLGLETMTERRVLLPQDCPEISLDFRKLQRVVSAAGTARFVAARDKNGHSDRLWAFLMALMELSRLLCRLSMKMVEQNNHTKIFKTTLQTADPNYPHLSRCFHVLPFTAREIVP